MNLRKAEAIIESAIKAAEEIGIKVSVAVVDENGFLVALHRMDGAPSPTPDMARDKAWTAASFGMPTEETRVFGTINTSNWNDRATQVPGGIPIKENGKIVGGIGVAGGKPDEDKLVAQKALEEYEQC